MVIACLLITLQCISSRYIRRFTMAAEPSFFFLDPDTASTRCKVFLKLFHFKLLIMNHEITRDNYST